MRKCWHIEMERKIMKYKEAAKRISVTLLALMMTLSMTGYTFVEAFAEDGEEPAAAAESYREPLRFPLRPLMQ